MLQQLKQSLVDYDSMLRLRTCPDNTEVVLTTVLCCVPYASIHPPSCVPAILLCSSCCVVVLYPL